MKTVSVDRAHDLTYKWLEATPIKVPSFLEATYQYNGTKNQVIVCVAINSELYNPEHKMGYGGYKQTLAYAVGEAMPGCCGLYLVSAIRAASFSGLSASALKSKMFRNETSATVQYKAWALLEPMLMYAASMFGYGALLAVYSEEENPRWHDALPSFTELDFSFINANNDHTLKYWHCNIPKKIYKQARKVTDSIGR